MKKVIKGLVIVIVSILVIIVVYIGVQFIQLRLYIKNEKVSVPELTALEKEEQIIGLSHSKYSKSN